MRKTLIGMAAAVFAALTLVAVNPAWGHNLQCAPRIQIMGQLTKKFSEAPVGIGVTNSGMLVEILNSDGGDSWTIIVSDPRGNSCILAAGEDWITKNLDVTEGEGGV